MVRSTEHTNSNTRTYILTHSYRISYEQVHQKPEWKKSFYWNEEITWSLIVFELNSLFSVKGWKGVRTTTFKSTTSPYFSPCFINMHSSRTFYKVKISHLSTLCEIHKLETKLTFHVQKNHIHLGPHGMTTGPKINTWILLLYKLGIWCNNQVVFTGYS